MKRKISLIALLAYLLVFVLLSYYDQILLGYVRRYDNAVMAAISAGIVFVIAALVEGSKFPRR